MIENLNGIHETVNFKKDTNLRLYENCDYEEYPTHWHTPLEIIMPLENHYIVESEGTKYDLKEGDILLICPGTLHHIPAMYGKRIIFQAEISSVFHLKDLESVLTIISPALHLTAENAPATHQLLTEHLIKIRKEYSDFLPLTEASIYSLLLEMLVEIGRGHTQNIDRFDVSHSKQKEYIDKFIKICNYISEHCTEDLTLDEVASLSGFSKYHFTRLFKQFADVTFYKYLNQKRIARSEQLLIDPKLTITDVSMQSGFSSLSAFIRMFKIIKGCTPSQFRNMYTSKNI